jgi:hypothetical protein
MFPIFARKNFDVILFVESPTPARKNGSANPTFAFRSGTPGADGAAEFHDPEFAVSVKLPKGWTIPSAFRWGDHETTAPLQPPNGPPAGQLYFRMRANPAANEEEDRKLLLGAPESKVKQRLGNGLVGYKIRPGSIAPRTVGGRPALACVAEYQLNGAPMVEYLVWVSGNQAYAQFFASVPEPELKDLQARLDPIIETLKLP